MKITDKTPQATFHTPYGEECTIHVQVSSSINVARVYEFPKVYRNSGEQRQVVKCELYFYWTIADDVPNEVTVRYPKDAKLEIYKYSNACPAIVNEEQY